MILIILIFVILVFAIILIAENEDVSIGYRIFIALFSAIEFIIIALYLLVWEHTPYKFNEKNINKKYVYENIVYKISIDTAATNEYVKSKFILKQK